MPSVAERSTDQPSVHPPATFQLPPRAWVPSLGDEELDQLTDLIYHPVSGVMYQRRFRFVLGQLDGTRLPRILEVGCGAGLLLPNLKRWAAQVVGCDLHAGLSQVREMLEQGEHANVPLVRGNVLSLPFRTGSFDALVCMSVLEHIRDLDQAIGELARVVHPEGQLILGFPAKNPLTRWLFGLIGRDDEVIHPSSHGAILEAARRHLQQERLFVFPRFLPKSCSLYLVGSFRHG